MELSWDTPRLVKMALSHLSSQVVAAINCYFALTDERDTICCFLVIHEIGYWLNCTNQPTSDRHVKGHWLNLSHNIHASTSHYYWEEKSLARFPFQARTTMSQCSTRGYCMNWDKHEHVKRVAVKGFYYMVLFYSIQCQSMILFY